jgi:AcrR family transcriptional regulator
MAHDEDPRATRSREAILAAARTLLATEGPPAVTHQRVAAQAGVGRATVYRHWPVPEELLLDAMVSVDLPFFREPTTPVRPWLHRELRKLANEQAMAGVIAVAWVLMRGAAQDPEVARRRDIIVASGTERLGVALALAVDSGELDTTLEFYDAFAVVLGPLLYRTMFQAGIVSDELIDQLLDNVGSWSPSR